MRKLKSQIVIKLKNSNCYETQQLKLGLKIKTQIAVKLTNTKYGETQKLKLG